LKRHVLEEREEEERERHRASKAAREAGTVTVGPA
jgi:hypothetical protein